MNDLSIFSSSIASCLRYVSDALPVPKSSTASRTPIARRLSSTSIARCGSVMTPLSVTSRVSRAGSTDHRSRAPATVRGSDASPRSRTEMFTATSRSMPSADHWHTWSSAASSTYEVMRPTIPVFSARETNSSGSTSPRVGCDQRTSASTPVTRSVLRSTFGW